MVLRRQNRRLPILPIERDPVPDSKRIILLLAVCLSACASAPIPLEALGDAEIAVATAVSADAEHYAPVELRFAREALLKAQSFKAARAYRDAAEWAQRALVNAELARLKTEAALLRERVRSQESENDAQRAKLNGSPR